MPLEPDINDKSTPFDFDLTSPSSTDQKHEGDDHLRNIKRVVYNFYRDMNFGAMEFGGIGALFNGKADPSGMALTNGGLEVDFPIGFRSAFVADPLTGIDAPLVYSPIGVDSKPYHIKTSAVTQVPGQSVDTSLQNSPFAVTLPVTTALVTTKLFIKGSGSDVSNVRITMRDTDANGAIILQTAADQEIINGGGFTLNGTGVTEIALNKYWISVPGTTVYLTMERYDSISGKVVDTGMTLKGVVSGGAFIPYFTREGYPYTLVELAEASNPVVSNLVTAEDKTSLVLSGAGQNLLTATMGVRLGKQCRWKVVLLIENTGTNGAYADIVLKFNGANVDEVAGTIGQAYVRDSGRIVPIVFEGIYDPVGTGEISAIVESTLIGSSITVHKRIFIMDEVS